MHFEFCILNFICTFATAYEQRIELWCNGNTADFGSVVLGSSPGSSTSLEITSVISFFVVVCQTNSTIESFFLLVQAPQTLSIVDATHLPQKNSQVVGTAHGIMGCEDIGVYCSLRCAIWYPRFGFAGRVPAAQHNKRRI